MLTFSIAAELFMSAVPGRPGCQAISALTAISDLSLSQREQLESVLTAVADRAPLLPYHHLLLPVAYSGADKARGLDWVTQYVALRKRSPVLSALLGKSGGFSSSSSGSAAHYDFRRHLEQWMLDAALTLVE